MKKNNSLNPVVVLGAGINGLGIIRSFEKTPIPVIAMSWYKDYGMSSRFCTYEICPNPLQEELLIDFLVEYGEKSEQKIILFATSDLFLMPVIKHKERLTEKFIIPVCDWSKLSPLIEKEFLYSFADKHDIPSPKTIIVKNIADFDGIADKMMFPLIIKPSVNITFSQQLGEKAFIISDKKSLEELIKKIAATDLCKDGIVVQEYIPGEVTDLYTITSYANKNSEIIGYSIGHKIRQYPPQTGTIVSGKIEHVEEIYTNADKLIKAGGFYGISNIEFKRDARDNSYKLMEINPRTGVWNSSALACGVNLPLMAYRDALGEKVEKEFNKEAKLVWLILPLDFYYALWGYKIKGYPEASISFRQWLRSLKGKKVEATFKWNDFIPFFKGLLLKFR